MALTDTAMTAFSVDLNLAATSSGFGESSRLALGNEMHELAGTGIADSRSSFADHTASLGGVGPADLGHGMQIGTAAETFTPSSFGNGALAGLATGVAIPAADTLLAAMGGIDGPMAVDGVDQARGTAEVWRGLGDVLDGLTGHGAEIDALLDSLPSHDGAMQALAAPLGFADTMMTHWMPDVAMSTMEMIAAHPDAVAQG